MLNLVSKYVVKKTVIKSNGTQRMFQYVSILFYFTSITFDLRKIPP